MTDEQMEQYLRSLGLTWVTVAEAVSDDYYEQTKQILKENPKISKIEFLKKLGIEEFKY